MITAIVRFPIPAEVSLEKASDLFQGSAPKYRGIPGLVRKYYLYKPGTAGGVYLWESQEQAEQFYNDDWQAMIRERYGANPEIEYLESPVIVDNAHDEVIVDAAE